MAALVEAAKKEGTLNVIALPPDWVSYGEMISGFEAKYGLKVSSTQPDPTNSEQISAATTLKGQSARLTCSTSAVPWPAPAQACSRRTR